MGTPTIDLEFVWKMAKGSADFGVISLSWDLTEGLTKEQYLRCYDREVLGNKIILLKSGRIIVPSMNIF